MNYKNWGRESLLKRLSKYAGYIGCGCYKPLKGGGCARQSTCARTDYRAMLSRLREVLRAPPQKPGGTP